jgi:hypothetical protein
MYRVAALTLLAGTIGILENGTHNAEALPREVAALF